MYVDTAPPSNPSPCEQEEKRAVIEAALAEGGVGAASAARLTRDDLLFLLTNR
jgi:hypothetical protein